MSSIKKSNSRPSTGSGNNRRGTTGGSTSGRNVGFITPTTKGQTGPRITGGSPISTLEYGVNNKLDNMYSGMLQHNAGSNPFAQLLASLGIDEDRWVDENQRADWNKQLMDAQLQYYQDLEKRQYTQEQLNEQRVYDSPLNQLARLMGAGVSRDAAIAMLSGQAGQPTIAESAVNTPGATASESRNAGVERALGIANAVFNGVSAVSGLASLGFTIPQAIQQTHFLKNQNLLTGRQLKAYDSTGQAYSLLKSINAGADAFGSVGSAIQAITQAANNGNADCAAFLQNGGANDMFSNVSFASQAMSQMYRSERASSDYERSFDAEMRKLDADTRLVNAQEAEVLKQIDLHIEEISKVYEEKRALRIQNDLEENFLHSVDEDSGMTGQELFNANRMQQLVQSYQTLARINNPHYWETYANSLINNAEFMEISTAVLTWFEDAKLGLLNENPELYTFLAGMRDCGFVEYSQYVQNTQRQHSESVSGNAGFSVGSKFFGNVSVQGGGSYSETKYETIPLTKQFFNQNAETANKVGKKLPRRKRK